MTESVTVTEKPDELTLTRFWESRYQPLTTRIIEGLPVRPGWRCLDLAGGAGSLAYWLAERVPQGTVLAVDGDIRFLDATRAPNLVVRQMDIAGADFTPGSFELVVARGALSGLANPGEVLTRAVRWLAPGGWLLVEDFYFLPSEDAPTAAGRAVVDAYTRGFQSRGADVRWARRLPALMARAGLTSLGVHVTPLGPGQSDGENALIRMRLELQGHLLVEAGMVSAEEIAEFIEQLSDPLARDVTTLQFSVWGQRTGD
jgi:SAM-dependent methyltransferase